MNLTDELKKALRLRVDYTNATDKYLGKKGFPPSSSTNSNRLPKRRTPTLRITAAKTSCLWAGRSFPIIRTKS